MHRNSNLILRLTVSFKRLQEQFLHDYFHHTPPEEMSDIWPTGTLVVDVFEDPEGYVLLADLPGREKNDINVQISNNILKISCERKVKCLQAGGYIYNERRHEAVQRAFPLPVGVDETLISSSFTAGVLEVKIPTKKEEKKAKKLLITVN